MSYIDTSKNLVIEAIIIKSAKDNLTHWELQERLEEAGFLSPELFNQIDAAHDDAEEMAANDPDLDVDIDGYNIVIVPKWWDTSDISRAGMRGMNFEMTALRPGSSVCAVLAA
jgi:NAD-dependent DNA ligase